MPTLGSPTASLVSLVAAIGLLQADASAFPRPAPVPPRTSPSATACESLSRLPINDTTVLGAYQVPASGDVVSHCRVLLEARPRILVDIRLPPDWNGKLYFGGCGGLCGKLLTEIPSLIMGDKNAFRALARGYVVAVTDTGHWGRDPSDARLLRNDPVAIENWAHAAVHRATVLAKQIAQVRYGKGVALSYFNGCSNGGRQGLVELMRYPDDFDGIIAGAPGTDFFGTVSDWNNVLSANVDSQGQPILGKPQFSLIEGEVRRTCGNADGIVEDPGSCRVDLARLQCTAGAHAGCLTAQQIDVAQTWYRGRPSATPAVYGIPYGSEASWWTSIGPQGFQAATFPGLVNDLLRPGQPPVVPGASFEAVADGFRTIAAGFDPTPDRDAIRRFRERGGRLILWHGLADTAALAPRTLRYFEKITAGESSTEASRWARLFLLPGTNHCGLVDDHSPGVDARGFEPLEALENWVERAEPPDAIASTKYDQQGAIRWTRPVCAYPLRAAYRGTGDRRDARNWQCRR